MPAPTLPSRSQRLLTTVAALALLARGAWGAADEAPVRRLLRLVRGIAQEYREAFDDRGTLVRPLELAEATLLLAEARTQPLPADGAARLAALADAVAARAPVAVVAARAGELRTALRDATGVDEELLPAAPPSAARGAALFREHCVSCHGDHGTGDGPDAARLPQPPPDFTDPVFMREETPVDFFLVVSLGRRRAAMPGWEDVLSLQQRWDLVSHLWSLHGTSQQIADGARLFVAHCARCHAPGAAAPAGGTVPAAPVPLTDLTRLAARSDADLYATISDGVHLPATPDVRGDAERWTLVAFVRSLSLGAPDGSGPAPSPADDADRLAHALARVAAGVRAAVDAYRLHEGEAVARAAEAYLRFEPLEPGIAAVDAAAVVRVEASFVRLQQALRRDDALPEVEAAAAAVGLALDAAQRAGAPLPSRGLEAVGTAALLALTVLLWGLLARRRRR